MGIDKPTSIRFEVKKWQHNKNITLKNPRTEATVMMHPLKNLQKNITEGIVFKWFLVIYDKDTEYIYFNCEEWVVVPNKNISDSELQEVLENSYLRAYGEAATKNLSIGLNTSFPDLEKIKHDLQDLRKVLDM